MSQPTLTLDAFREQSRKIQQARADARRDYERYAEAAADAERDYRRELATAFARAKALPEDPTKAPKTAAQAEVQAHSDAAEAKHKRDLAQAMAKSCLLRIEALEADRATLRSVAQWSQAIDSIGVGGVAS